MSFLFIIVVTLITQIQAFCGSYPALTGVVTFSRDRGDKRDGAFDFPKNGYSHSFYGWFRISDSMSRDIEFQMARYESIPNNGDSLPKVYSNLFLLSYQYKYSSRKLVMQVANSAEGMKTIELDFEAGQYEWIYFGFTHDSKAKKGVLTALSAKAKNTKEFTTDYTYELRQMFKIWYGAYSMSGQDVVNGLIGEIGPFFYSNNYYQQIHHYWRTSYFKTELMKTDHVRLEYLFDEYTNVNEIKDRVEGEPGKIEGEGAEYNGKTGITLKGGTQITIANKVTTLMKFSNTLCYFFALNFFEPMPDEFRLLGKGPKDKKHSFFIFLNKIKGKRHVVVKVGYETSKGSPKTMTFQMEKEILPESYNELQVCFTMTQDFISGSMAYLNGKAEFFDVVKQLGYNYDQYQDKHVILDKDAKFDGHIILTTFNIIEGGGGFINSQEEHPDFVSTCRKQCKLPSNDLVMSYKCLVCMKKSNNVNNPATKTCDKNCISNHKNLHGFCVKCSESNCAEKDMPKMIIKKANKYYTKFKINPSKKLWKDLEDWPKRISTKVSDFKEGKDYDIKFKVEKDNLIWMNFDAKHDFKEKNITITIKDVKEVYDTDGNMMHDNKASFYIKGYIKYPETTQKMVKGVGKTFAGLFALAAVTGIIANFATSMLNLPSLTGALIGMFEILQYLTFLMFLNTELPPACDDFISTLFENTIELGALLNEFIIKLNIKNINFAFNYDLDTPPKFQKEEIRYMLLLNAAIPFLVQLGVVLLWLSYRLMYCFCGCCSVKVRKFLKRKIEGLEYEGLIALLFMFDIEMVVFSALNLWHPIKVHWVMSISYNMSIFYLIIISLSIPLVIFITNRPREVLESKAYKKNWGIIYEDYRLNDSTSRFFKAFSILRFLVFGLLLVFAYYIPLIQISASFFIAVGYLVLIIFKRPHKSKSEFFLEFITELLFTLGNFFFFVLALDESYNIVTVETRVQVGWFIVVIFVIALAISILLVLIPALKAISQLCGKKKKKEKDDDESEEESEDESESKEGVEMQPKAKKNPELETSRLNTSVRKLNKQYDTHRTDNMDGEGGNAFANYKGVMMCTRPQDKTNVTIERPFCSRVTPGTEMGINPNKPTVREEKKQGVLPAMANHRKWLDGFKEEIEVSKAIQAEAHMEEELKKIRIKQKAEETRQLIREGGPFPEAIIKSKIEKRTRPLSPKTHFKMKQEEETQKLIQSLGINPGFDSQVENNQNEANQPTTHHIVLPSMEQKQKVKFDLPEETETEQFAKQSMPQLENNQHQMVESELPGVQEANGPPPQQPQEHCQIGNLKKKSKPAWARTTDQQDELEDVEDEALLNFMDNLNFDQYVEDVEIKNLLQSLKDRVQNLKEEPDWKEKWKLRLKEKTEKRKQQYLEEKEKRKQDDDNMSVISSTGGDSQASFLFGGEALTVSSSRTQESIQELKDKISQKKNGKSDWDKNNSVASNQSDLENRIAKHIADEILRTNMAMSKIHSNQSIRRIMEQELKSQLRTQQNIEGDGLEALNEDEMEELYL